MTGPSQGRRVGRHRPGALAWVAPALVLALAVALGHAAWAQTVARVPVRAGVHDGYGRIVFDWTEPVTHQTRVEGTVLLVTFDRPLIPSLAAVFQRLGDYVTKSGMDPDGQSVRFTLTGPFEVRSFLSGTAVVIDLVGREEDPSPPPPPVATRTPATVTDQAPPSLSVRFGEHPDFNRVVFDWPAQVPYRIDREGDRTTLRFERPAVIDLDALRQRLPPMVASIDAELDGGTLSVTLGVSANAGLKDFLSGSKVVVDVLQTAPVTDDETPGDAEIARTSAPETAEPPAAPETAEPPAAPEPDVTQEVAPTVAEVPVEDTTAPAAPELATALAQGELAVIREDLPDGLSLRFDWNTPVAAAVFARSGYLWVVFDAPATLRFDQIEGAAPVITAAEQLPIAGRTVARFDIDPTYRPLVSRVENSWTVELGSSDGPNVRIPVVFEESSAVGTRILLTEKDTGNEIYVVDPEVGDELVVVPVEGASHGVDPGRRFVDLELLATAQGAAIRSISDTIAVRALREGIEISSLSGLHLSPQTHLIAETSELEPELEPEDAGEEASQVVLEVALAPDDTPMFDFPAWRRYERKGFRDSVHQHNLDLAFTPKENRHEAALDQARFYFANGWAPETLGWIRRAVEEAPWLEKDPAVHALRGAANVMLDRLDSAGDDLFNESLDASAEMALWRGLFLTKSGQLGEAARQFARSGDLIDRYPAMLRAPFRLLMAEASIGVRKLETANAMLDLVMVDRPKQRLVDRGAYLRGLLTAVAGRPLDAIDLLAQPAQSEDRQTRGLAARARIELMMDQGMLPPEDVIEALESLRFVWRGGDFELNLLSRLGELYVANGQYDSGLNTYREVISVFPDSPKVREIAQIMNDSFVDLFLGGLADQMAPIAALAIYNDFRELTPVGNLGDQLIFRLSDRLVSVDLLEQAAKLLQHQVEYRLQGVELARVGARLAQIYLLDEKPDEAATALGASDVVRLDPLLADQRRYQLGRARAKMEQFDAALDLLRGDQSREANRLRADVYWAKQDWLATATVLARMLRDRDPDAESLAAEEVEQLMKMAVALALTNNRPALAELRAKYGSMMDQTANGQAFRAISSYVDGGPIDVTNMSSTVAEIDTYEAYMASLRERVAGDSLSSVN